MIQTPFRWFFVSGVPRKRLGCSGSMLPVLPTFFTCFLTLSIWNLLLLAETCYLSLVIVCLVIFFFIIQYFCTEDKLCVSKIQTSKISVEIAWVEQTCKKSLTWEPCSWIFLDQNPDISLKLFCWTWSSLKVSVDVSTNTWIKSSSEMIILSSSWFL